MIFCNTGNLIHKELDELLKTYYMSTGVSILAIDTNGQVLTSYGDSFSFCDLVHKFNKLNHSCKDFHLKACKLAIDIGEPYFFYCPIDFVHIAIPLLNNRTFSGGIIVGPIIMNHPSNKDHKQFILQDISTHNIDVLSKHYDHITTADPIRINYLGNMLFMMASREMDNYESYLNEKKLKMDQQSRINEYIQMYKNISDKNTKLNHMENDLFYKVREGKVIEAKTILNELIAYIYYENGSNISLIKAGVMDVCTLLSRAAIDCGAPVKEMLAFNYLLFDDLNKLKSLEEISYWMLKVLDYYIENSINLYPNEIEKSILYINKHFKNDIKISDVADHVHLNPRYFSSLFKKEVGVCFSEYLQKIRIEESKFLICNTNKSILEVSTSLRFSDQSYFTKVFKKFTGMTPKQYVCKFR
ncbi:MAG: PocR ligand-binding domain-containing protein [Clostridia bacterium]|nr:PocR ligand-binding domain-containing protein [Clostridia bacterium]